MCVLLGVASSGAQAQDKKIVLRVADSFPPNHYMPPIVKAWMDSVKSASGGVVEFEYYPAEQLGKAKDLLALTLSGVADIGYVAPAYVSDKMPLSGVVHLPGAFKNSCSGTMAFWALGKEGGLLAQKEFTPNGVRLLFAVALAPYQVFSAKKKIESTKDFEGMKLRSTGGVMDLTVRKIKAVPVQMASPEVYQSLDRGTLDGGMFPFTTVLDYDWGGLLKYSTIGENFGSFIVTYVISESKWKELPPAVQKAMNEAGEATTRRACAQLDRDEQIDIDKLRKIGVTMVTLGPESHAEIARELDRIGEDWAKTLDQRGKPGTEVLKAFTQAVK
jgi:TRAP-type C4-dicarboxylate transport system substrate-binding protein